MDIAAEHDVVVLGAGAAGACAAIRLAQMGLNVAVVERRRFPRGHVGICIADETVALVDYLGVGAAFARAEFWRRRLTAVRWGEPQAKAVPQNGFHLDRGVFDEMLLGKARACGAATCQPAEVLAIDRNGSTGWRVAIAHDQARRVLRARFLVDAAGRRAALRGVRIKDGPPLAALHAIWRLEAAPPFDGFIEAGEDAWIWFAQTASDAAIVSVFSDPRRFKARGKGGLQSRYVDLLRQFAVVKPDALGRQAAGVHACDAASQHAADPVGDGYIRIGDACMSIDPLASQGVHLALQSGLQGAVVVNTVLRKPENAEAALRFHRQRVEERVNRYRDRTRQEYARGAGKHDTAFWRERGEGAPPAQSRMPPPSPSGLPALPSGTLSLSPDAILKAAPVIDGAFVEVRQVVAHPALAGDIAYLEGADLSRLLSALPPTFAYGDLPELWRPHAPPATASRIAAWLWERRLLVRAT